jgi:hypothetical protein
VIPTVFSNEKDFVAIEHRFRDLIDFKRAKQLFVNSIKNNLTPAKSKGSQSVMNLIHSNDVAQLQKNGRVETCLSSQENNIVVIDCDDSDTDLINCTEKKQKVNWWSDTDVTTLTAMGFDESRARWALSMAHTVEQAIETILVDTSAATNTTACRESLNTSSSSSVQNNVRHASSNAIKEKGITHYFSPKKN